MQLNGFVLVNCVWFVLIYSHQLPDLPADHLRIYLKHSQDKGQCDDTNKHQSGCDLVADEHRNRSCWGYEDTGCNDDQRYLMPECPGPSNGWSHNKAEQLRVFMEQGDFGYVSDRMKEMETICSPRIPSGSSLRCSSYLRYCVATNILLDFERLANVEEPIKYRDDVIGPGGIGGWNCDLNRTKLKAQSGHRSPLQSWYAELEHYEILHESTNCDITITKPTFIMKLDATVNMYHHFCDFVNLYASLHMNNSFSLDNNIIIWDTYSYRSNFAPTWNAFTKNPLLNLSGFKGKRVCLKNAVFPLLPRMVFGLYYNMPLIPGCLKSGLFHAFNRHVLYKLGIEQTYTTKNETNVNRKVIRITFLSRNTKYRRILNEEMLINQVKQKSRHFHVQRVEFTHHTPFVDQLKIIQNTDILIGMHGAGLTHTLFQPDWGVLFETYNCDDENCYKDLARLRGTKYITWEKADKIYPEDDGHHPEMGAHKKFTNYVFDGEEFLRLVMVGVKHVRKERTKFFTQTENKCNDIGNNCEAFNRTHKQSTKNEL